MPRVKKCRVCKATLYCQKCGTRQTPEVPDKSKFTMLLTDEEREALREKAKKEGKTVAAYIREHLKLN